MLQTNKKTLLLAQTAGLDSGENLEQTRVYATTKSDSEIAGMVAGLVLKSL